MLSLVEKVLFLKSINLFSQIPGADLAHIARIAVEESFDRNEVIITEGDTGDSLYLTISGRVKVHIGSRELAELGERECFGEMAILDSEPRSASITAVQDTLCLKIAREDFYEIMNEKPDIAHGVIKVLTKRLRDANQ